MQRYRSLMVSMSSWAHLKVT